MIDLSRHPYFEPWRDPETGVLSYVLTQRVAPVQQSFYYTNPSLSADQRWLWLYTSFPPGPARSLAAVSLDPDQPRIVHFPAAQFQAASPCVSDDGDSCWFACRDGVWLQTIDAPQPDCRYQLPRDFVGARPVHRVATHLTLSADRGLILLDGHVGAHWFVAVAERQTGQVRILKEFATNTNHAQFSPTDPNLFMLADDHWHDPASGRFFHYNLRTWLMTVDQTLYQPLQPRQWRGHGHDPCHEWWDAQGRVCWVDYTQGVYRCPPQCDAEPELIWPRPLCHAHCDAAGRFWCADQSPYTWDKTPCQVLFFDHQTGRETAIASGLPQPAVDRGMYHIDPHPQFSPQGDFIVYTTTVRGMVDVALTPVEPLVTPDGEMRA